MWCLDEFYEFYKGFFFRYGGLSSFSRITGTILSHFCIIIAAWSIWLSQLPNSHCRDGLNNFTFWFESYCNCLSGKRQDLAIWANKLVSSNNNCYRVITTFIGRSQCGFTLFFNVFLSNEYSQPDRTEKIQKIHGSRHHKRHSHNYSANTFLFYFPNSRNSAWHVN